MPRISEDERALRRDRLVDAAWRCLARSSDSELTVDDVCAEASVSKGGFYGHFESKQELLHELLLRESTSLDAVIASLSDAPIEAAERLRRFARACLKDAKDSARMQIRADLASAVGGDPAIESALRDIARRRRAACARGSRRVWHRASCASCPPMPWLRSCSHWPTASPSTIAAIRPRFSGGMSVSPSMP